MIPVKFTWKDHLRGIYATMIGDGKLQLRMRIKHLHSLGYDDMNPMVTMLKRILEERENG